MIRWDISTKHLSLASLEEMIEDLGKDEKIIIENVSKGDLLWWYQLILNRPTQIVKIVK